MAMADERARLLRDLWSKDCTCKWWKLKHARECPALRPVPRYVAKPEYPFPVQWEGRRHEPPERPAAHRAREYVGIDWPTMSIPVVRICPACVKDLVMKDEDFCERCDQFTHIWTLDGEVTASYDDFGNRVNLKRPD